MINMIYIKYNNKPPINSQVEVENPETGEIEMRNVADTSNIDQYGYVNNISDLELVGFDWVEITEQEFKDMRKNEIINKNKIEKELKKEGNL